MTKEEKDLLFKYIDTIDLSLNATAGWLKELSQRQKELINLRKQELESLVNLLMVSQQLLNKTQGVVRVEAYPLSKET